jgi:hypothetical protein
MKRVEVLVPVAAVEAIRTAAAILRDVSKMAVRSGRRSGSDTLSGRQTAFDVFALTKPLSAKGQALWDDAMAQVARDRKNPVLNRARNFDL